ncbi:MAG: AGE family epimerase/isomerase, partial [Gammaproteobacteria bacterium]|nr:AGE family epimerase/isomerase [Gammaproteobacteria bacterium]
SQARVLWFFARLMTTAYRSQGHEAAARHGFQFLRDSFWDGTSGGFFWEVDSTGRTPIKVDKHLYGQAFGLYAIAEYAIATQDSEAESMAQELYSLLERHAHDAANGGYREFLRRDWRRPESSSATYMESRADIKQLNTHIHLLEAFTRYSDLAPSTAVRDRLIELILIQSNTAVRKEIVACTDIHDVDWTPSPHPAHSWVTYGHDLENIWLLIEACNAAALPNTLLRDVYESLFYNAWRFGFDRRRGGVFYQGRLGKFATARNKLWWVQAEALLCALHMYCLTHRQSYFRCFRETLDWIVGYQVDWDVGEWHRLIRTDRTPSGGKTGDQTGGWKTPYHNGRAIIHCLDLITDEQTRISVSQDIGAAL